MSTARVKRLQPPASAWRAVVKAGASGGAPPRHRRPPRRPRWCDREEPEPREPTAEPASPKLSNRLLSSALQSTEPYSLSLISPWGRRSRTCERLQSLTVPGRGNTALSSSSKQYRHRCYQCDRFRTIVTMQSVEYRIGLRETKVRGCTCCYPEECKAAAVVLFPPPGRNLTAASTSPAREPKRPKGAPWV